MSSEVQRYENDIKRKVQQALNNYPELVRQIRLGTILHRVQPSRYDANPVHYRANSDTRYADTAKRVGVYYLGFTEEVALAESFQPGQGVDDQPVRLPNWSRRRCTG